MTDYQIFINALRKCVEEHANDITPTGHIVVSTLCKDTANLLEKLEQEPFINKPCISTGVCHEDKVKVLDKIRAEIEGNMESIIGKYDSSIPKFNMPSYKIERNKVREECISIIDKCREEQTE